MTARTRPAAPRDSRPLALALRTGELVVLPTDTVYGIGADAFYPSAVNGLLAAKGRGRDMPPPVLVGTVRAATALIEDLGPYGKDLIDEFWPGGLTLVCRANRSLNWDLGDTQGTVAVRMPLHAGRARTAQGDRPAGGEQRQPHRPPAPPPRPPRRRSSSATRCPSTWTAGRAPTTSRPRSWTSPGTCRGCCGRAAVSVGRLREVAMLSTGGDVTPGYLTIMAETLPGRRGGGSPRRPLGGALELS